MAPEVGARRRALLRASFERAITLASEMRVDALCVAGDLFERDSATVEIGEFLRGLFARLHPIPVLIAPGNHDFYRPGCLYDRVSWSDNVHVFRSHAATEITVADGLVVGAAFTTAKDDGWLSLPRAASDRPRVGLFHADLVEGRTVESRYRPVRRQDLHDAGLAFALLGHWHSALLDREGRAAYTGSLEPLDRTECGERWVHLLTVDSAGATSEVVPIAVSSVVEVAIDVTGISSAGELVREIERRIDGHADDFVALVLTGERTGELALDWPAALGAVSVAVASVDDRTNALGDWQRYRSERSVRGRFVDAIASELEQAGDDAAKRRLLDELAVGLAALEGRQALPL